MTTRSEKMKKDVRDKKDKAVGKAKQAAGDITDNRKLHAKGKAQEAAGRTREKARDVAEGARRSARKR